MSGNGSKYKLTLGYGTCGIAAGATAVKEALEQELDKGGYDARFDIVGCMGLCFMEPVLEVSEPDGVSVVYGELVLYELYLGSVAAVSSATVLADGTSISATFAAEAQGWTVLFGEELLLKPGQTLHISIQ